MSNILIVDDNIDIAEMMSDYLKIQGYSTTTTYNGADALASVDEIVPDLVLLDIDMPGMDGIEVCQKMRLMDSAQLIPIVFITGKTEDQILLEAIKAGCDDFISKPPDLPILKAKIKTLLKMSRLRNQLQEKEKFEYLIQHMSEGLIITDRQGLINSCNTTAARVFSINLEKLPAESFFQIIDKSFQRVPLKIEEIIIKKQGDFIIYRSGAGFKLTYALNINFDVITNPFSDNEEIVFICKEDTTRLNEEYRKDLVVTMMKHKFNTLDAITQLNLDALGHLIESPNPSMESKIIKGLKESSSRMTTIVKSVLDFLDLPNKINDKQKELITTASIKTMVEKIAEELDQNVLNINLQCSKNVLFEMFEGGLYRILYELVENVFKFGDQSDLGLKIQVEMHKGQGLLISVFNRGDSIVPEEINRIWDRFYQMDPQFTGQIKGIGLGLSTVKYIVELSGGTAKVISNQDGTTFRLILPAQKVNTNIVIESEKQIKETS